MPICTIEEAIQDMRQGRMIILVDDEDRENEGDLTIAAEFVTPEAINFMVTHARGLVCLPLGPAWVDKLALPRPAYRGIAGHVADRVEVDGEDRDLASEPRGGKPRLYPGVTRSDYRYIRASGKVRHLLVSPWIR